METFSVLDFLNQPREKSLVAPAPLPLKENIPPLIPVKSTVSKKIPEISDSFDIFSMMDSMKENMPSSNTSLVPKEKPQSPRSRRHIVVQASDLLKRKEATKVKPAFPRKTVRKPTVPLTNLHFAAPTAASKYRSSQSSLKNNNNNINENAIQKSHGQRLAAPYMLKKSIEPKHKFAVASKVDCHLNRNVIKKKSFTPIKIYKDKESSEKTIPTAFQLNLLRPVLKSLETELAGHISAGSIDFARSQIASLQVEFPHVDYMAAYWITRSSFEEQLGFLVQAKEILEKGRIMCTPVTSELEALESYIISFDQRFPGLEVKSLKVIDDNGETVNMQLGIPLLSETVIEPPVEVDLYRDAPISSDLDSLARPLSLREAISSAKKQKKLALAVVDDFITGLTPPEVIVERSTKKQVASFSASRNATGKVNAIVEGEAPTVIHANRRLDFDSTDSCERASLPIAPAQFTPRSRRRDEMEREQFDLYKKFVPSDVASLDVSIKDSSKNSFEQRILRSTGGHSNEHEVKEELGSLVVLDVVSASKKTIRSEFAEILSQNESILEKSKKKMENIKRTSPRRASTKKLSSKKAKKSSESIAKHSPKMNYLTPVRRSLRLHRAAMEKNIADDTPSKRRKEIGKHNQTVLSALQVTASSISNQILKKALVKAVELCKLDTIMDDEMMDANDEEGNVDDSIDDNMDGAVVIQQKKKIPDAVTDKMKLVTSMDFLRVTDTLKLSDVDDELIDKFLNICDELSATSLKKKRVKSFIFTKAILLLEALSSTPANKTLHDSTESAWKANKALPGVTLSRGVKM